MALALENVYSQLHVYARARRSPEAQLELLGEIDELAAAGVGAEELMEAAGRCGGS